MEKTRRNDVAGSDPDIENEDGHAEQQLCQRLAEKMRVLMGDGLDGGGKSSMKPSAPLEGAWKVLITLVRQLCAILSNGLEVMRDVGKGVEDGRYLNILVASDGAVGDLIFLEDVLLSCYAHRSNRLGQKPLLENGKRKPTLFTAVRHIKVKRNIQRRMRSVPVWRPRNRIGRRKPLAK